MLTQEQRKEIRKISLFEAYFKEKEGIPYSGQKSVVIPDFWEIRKEAINKILQQGFKEVEMVSHRQANCIIRVYTKRHFKYEMDEIHNIYGFHCYVKEDGKWISESSNVFEINYKTQLVTCFLYQDESVTYNCDFVDTYVKIT